MEIVIATCERKQYQLLKCLDFLRSGKSLMLNCPYPGVETTPCACPVDRGNFKSELWLKHVTAAFCNSTTLIV